MDFRVVFMGVEVEADSESEAIAKAAESITEDPYFYLEKIDLQEDDEVTQ
jgi:hypothetical protein